MVVPGLAAPVAKGLIKGIDKVADATDVARILKADNPIDEAKNTINTIHGNSKSSTKAQHAYDIIDTESNTVVKTGVSGVG